MKHKITLFALLGTTLSFSQDYSGRVGINTETPNATLEVKGPFHNGERVGIITIVGQSFMAQYRAVYRNREMYNTQSNIQIQPEDMQPLEFPKMKLSNMELRKLAMEIITKKAKKPLREVNNLKLAMKLNNVYVMSDYIFLDVSFENKTFEILISNAFYQA